MTDGTAAASEGVVQADRRYQRAILNRKAAEDAVTLAQEEVGRARMALAHAELRQWDCPVCDAAPDADCTGIDGKQVHTLRAIPPERRR